jgi:CRP/FNR family transcriptional regulator, cyclic AMP receptor protein
VLESVRGANLNDTRNPLRTDLDRLTQLNAFSWLSASELRLLASSLAALTFKRHQLILQGMALGSQVHVLLSGVARITCQNSRPERVTIALLAPGPIPGFLAPPLSRFAFQCEAYKDSRVGSVSRKDLERITGHNAQLMLTKLNESDLRQSYCLMTRSASFLNLELHDRVALALLELCSEFGVDDSRGTLLREPFSHQDIADLVGASRPRVTEHLARLEHDRFVLRDGRRLIVRVKALSESIAAPASMTAFAA